MFFTHSHRPGLSAHMQNHATVSAVIEEGVAHQVCIQFMQVASSGHSCLVALPKQFGNKGLKLQHPIAKFLPRPMHCLNTFGFCMFGFQCADSRDVCTYDRDSSCKPFFTFWRFSRRKNLGLKSGYKMMHKKRKKHQQTSCSTVVPLCCLLWRALTRESQREGSQIHLSFFMKAFPGQKVEACDFRARCFQATCSRLLRQASPKQAIESHGHVCSQSFAHPQLDRMILMTQVVVIDWLDGTVRMRIPEMSSFEWLAFKMQ